MQNTKPLDDLELYELIVAAYPEKFGAREKAGDDIWDEVMEFIECELCGDQLEDWQGLARFLGRIVMLTMPMASAVTGVARHCLGPIETSNGKRFMMAAVVRDVVKTEEVAHADA